MEDEGSAKEEMGSALMRWKWQKPKHQWHAAVWVVLWVILGL